MTLNLNFFFILCLWPILYVETSLIKVTGVGYRELPFSIPQGGDREVMRACLRAL